MTSSTVIARVVGRTRKLLAPPTRLFFIACDAEVIPFLTFATGVLTPTITIDVKSWGCKVID
jgi:hypothetical protein